MFIYGEETTYIGILVCTLVYWYIHWYIGIYIGILVYTLVYWYIHWYIGIYIGILVFHIEYSGEASSFGRPALFLPQLLADKHTLLYAIA